MHRRSNEWLVCLFSAFGLLSVVFAFYPKSTTAERVPKPYSSWSDYAGSPDSLNYSILKQINKSNVSELKLVWFVPAPGPVGRFSFDPLVIDGVMYIVGRDHGIYALDAATGKQIWAHPVEGGQPTNRGFNCWISKNGRDRRLIFAVDGYLQEVNMNTGKSIRSFGSNGKVDLREGLGRNLSEFRQGVQSGSPGRVFENLIILGSAPGEMYDSPPGDLRAYDVRTGKMVWIFHTVPHPGEFGNDTFPPDAWKYIGGNNAWGGISLDEKRGVVYFPLGSPTYDLYGADRKGSDLYGDCLLALDARTGKRVWYFQIVHHDLWDYDPAAAPLLLTVKHGGKNVDVVAEATKLGFLYVFDRVTGKPIWPVEERPVPASDMPGEASWPTQPFPTVPPPFARQKFTLNDINPYLDPDEMARIRNILLNARSEGIFTPPAYNRDQIAVPGENGGANQGSTAADPSTGVMYVKTYDEPTIHRLSETVPGNQLSLISGTPEQRGYAMYSRTCIACHGPNPTRIPYPKQMDFAHFTAAIRAGNKEMPAFSDAALPPDEIAFLAAYLQDPAAGETTSASETSSISAPSGQVRYYGQFGLVFQTNSGLPAFSPPWSSIVAYDLNKGTILWRRPIGTTPGLAAKGITDTGSSELMRNGPVVTAGGLLFLASGPDRMVHSLDKDTGKTLWETQIDANPDGIPAVYQVAGREYVAFYAAVTSTKASISYDPGKPGAQGYYVFALPQPASSQ